MTVPAQEGRLPRAGGGAERELERLFDRHAEDVRRHVLLVLRNGNDAEDVVQQTFLKALRALRSGIRPEWPRRWLVAIAHNECRMHLRAASRRPAEVELDLAVGHASASDGSPSAGELRRALGHLAPRQRAALVLRELEDRSYAEIALALDVTESAVEALLFRARRALREQLEEQDDCADAQVLIAADVLDELSRRRLRAHIRSCPACATLERRRRGRLAAAGRKLGAVFPFPLGWPSLFGGAGAAKVAAAVVVVTVAAGGAAEVTKTDVAKTRPIPAAAPPHRNPSERPVARSQAGAAVAVTEAKAGRAAAARPVAKQPPAPGDLPKRSAEAQPGPAPAPAVEEALAPVDTQTGAAPAAPPQPPRDTAATGQAAVPEQPPQPPSPPVSLPSLPSSPSLPPVPSPPLPPAPPPAPSAPSPPLPPLPAAPTVPSTPLPPLPAAPSAPSPPELTKP